MNNVMEHLTGDQEPPSKRQRVASSTGPDGTFTSVREELQNTVDPYLQGALLHKLAQAAILPTAKTKSAIDYLFSFLQQQRQAQDNGQGNSSDSRVVLAAVLRSLRDMLSCKPTVVAPMVQADDMADQLRNYTSAAEDSSLRRAMLGLVFDWMLYSKRMSDAANLLLDILASDHDDGIQLQCLKGLLHLHSEGFQPFRNQDPAKNAVSMKNAMQWLIGGTSSELRVFGARLLVALNDAPNSVVDPQQLETTTSPSSSDMPLTHVHRTQTDETFLTLCMAAHDSSINVRLEVTLSMRHLMIGSTVSSNVLEHALQKTSIDETTSHADVSSTSRLMRSSGMLLSLLEDEEMKVVMEASRTIQVLCSKVPLENIRALDRVILEHLHILPTVMKAPTVFQTICSTLKLLLRQHTIATDGKKFELSREEFLYIHQTATTLDSAREVTSILSVLVCCDVRSSWMVKHLIELVLLAGRTWQSPWDTFHPIVLSVLKDLSAQCESVVALDSSLLHPLRLAQKTSKSENERESANTLCEMLTQSEKTSTVDNDHPKDAWDSFMIKQPTDRSASLQSDGDKLNLMDKEKCLKNPQTTFTEIQRRESECADNGYMKRTYSILRVMTMIKMNQTGTMQSTKLQELHSELFHHVRAVYARTRHLSRNAHISLIQTIVCTRMGALVQLLASNKRDTQDTSIRTIQTLLTYLPDDMNLWIDKSQMLSSLKSIEFEALDKTYRMMVSDMWLGQLLDRSNVGCKLAKASLTEPNSVEKKKPLELTAQWPSQVLVRGWVQDLPDDATVVIKCKIPGGHRSYHPIESFGALGGTWRSFEQNMTLRLPAMSDPTKISLTICIACPAMLSRKDATKISDPLASNYVTISEPVKLAISVNPAISLR